MAAVIERFDYGFAILKADDSFGSSADAGTAEFGEADLSDSAENGRDGKVVGNYHCSFLFVNDRLQCPPGALLQPGK